MLGSDEQSTYHVRVVAIIVHLCIELSAPILELILFI